MHMNQAIDKINYLVSFLPDEFGSTKSELIEISENSPIDSVCIRIRSLHEGLVKNIANTKSVDIKESEKGFFNFTNALKILENNNCLPISIKNRLYDIQVNTSKEGHFGGKISNTELFTTLWDTILILEWYITAIQNIDIETSYYSSNFENKIKELNEKNISNLSYLKPIALKESVKFDKLYIPLTISSREKSFLVHENNSGLFKYRKRIVIKNTAGMGKSVLMRKLYLSCFKQNDYIPIFIELRNIKFFDSFDRLLYKEIGIFEEKDIQYFSKSLANGNFIFFFDGYDEIPLDIKSETTLILKEFIKTFGNNSFFISSREEESLDSFTNFETFKIKPLTCDEAFNLIRKYDIENLIAEILIENIKSSVNFSSLQEFLKNPLLVTLLFLAFDFKHEIPLKKSLFYDQIYDALYERHDASKNYFRRGKYSSLHKDEFHSVLRKIAYDSFKSRRVAFTKDEMVKYINMAKDRIPQLNFNPSDFLKDLIETVPLFIFESSMYYWAHKSLQEYFAAEFIYHDSKEQQNSILKTIYSRDANDYYKNLLDMYYDIDYRAFKSQIIKPFLKEYIVFCNSAYQELSKNIHQNEISKRIELTFGYEIGFVLFSEKNIHRVKPLYEKFCDLYPYQSELIETKHIEFPNKKILFVFIKKRNYKTILEILSDKMEKFVKKVVVSEDVTCPKLEEGKLYILDESGENKLNLQNNYICINKILENVIEITLDTKKARNQFEYLEMKEKINEVDNLTAGL